MTKPRRGRPATDKQRVFFVVSVARARHGLFSLVIEEIARFSEEIAQFIEKHTNGPKLVVPLCRLDRERSRRLWGFVAAPMASRSGLSGLFARGAGQVVIHQPHTLSKRHHDPPAAAPLQSQTKSTANKPCFSSIKTVSSVSTAIGYRSPCTCASPSQKLCAQMD